MDLVRSFIPVNGIPFIWPGVDLRFHDIDHSDPENLESSTMDEDNLLLHMPV